MSGFALPLIEHAGGGRLATLYLTRSFIRFRDARVAKGDAVLRIGGASAGADEMVALGDQHGKAIYWSMEEIRRQTPVEASSHSGDVALQIESVALKPLLRLQRPAPCSSLSLPRPP